MHPWIELYKPQKLDDVAGHDQEKEALKSYVESYTQQKKKALILYGPTGTGKTSAVHALANELGLELLEVNASDTRNAAAIESILGNAVGQMSLFGGSKLILIDDADGLSGSKDRGGLQAMVKVIDKSSFPIIITLEDPYNRKFKALTKKCTLVSFAALPYATIAAFLAKIARQEHISFEQAAMDQLGRMADGDLRAALNDLQLLTIDGFLDQKSLADYYQREKKETMQQALFKVFKSKQLDVVLPAFDQVSEDLDKIFLWMDQNLSREYEGKDLATAYDALSRADVFFGRIRRWQYYRFYVYCYALVTAGVALAKEHKNPERVDYRETTRLLKIWMANQKLVRKKSIAQKLADLTHVSQRRALEDVALLKTVFKKNQQQAGVIAEQLELNNEEVAWLEG